MSTGQLQASLGAPPSSCSRVEVAPWPMSCSQLECLLTFVISGELPAPVRVMSAVRPRRCHHVLPCPARSLMSNMSIFAILTFQFSWHWVKFHKWLILQCYHYSLVYSFLCSTLLRLFLYYHFNKQDGRWAKLSKIKICLDIWNLHVILLNPGQSRCMIF